MGSPIVCEWQSPKDNWYTNWYYRGKRVVLDEEAGTVSFVHCHRRRRFWAVNADPSFVCQFSEVLAIHVERDSEYGGSTCWVSTLAGRAVFDSRMTGYDEVVQAMRRHIVYNHGPLVDNPRVWNAAILILSLLVILFLVLFVWLGWL